MIVVVWHLDDKGFMFDELKLDKRLLINKRLEFGKWLKFNIFRVDVWKNVWFFKIGAWLRVDVWRCFRVW